MAVTTSLSADTYVVYVADGTTTSFTYTFPRLATKDISVFVDDAIQTVVDDFTHPANGTVEFVTAPGSGTTVEVRRDTKTDSPRVTFSNSATFGETAMNTAYLHMLYVAQEMKGQEKRYIKLASTLVNLVVPLNLASGGSANMVASVDRVDTGAGKLTQDKASATLTMANDSSGYTTVTLEQGAATTSDIIEGEAC